MYEHNANQLILPDKFFLPFGGSLNPDNRWIVMASLIPWSEVEKEYKKRLGNLNEGSKAYSVRLALGSLIIKEKLGLSDEETVLAITENPYLQYFIGLHSFQEKAPFDSSSLTHFRKRFDADIINDINEQVIQNQQKMASEKSSENDSSDDDDWTPTSGGSSQSGAPKKTENNYQGKLLLDATCTPSDITYPTDIGLLNAAREKLEGIIDTLHAPFVGKQHKPRTYRQKARKQYLALSKQRKPRIQKIRKAVNQQLGYVRHNLKHIEKLGKDSLHKLSNREYRDLLVIQEMYRQQAIMHKENSSSINDRIV